MTIVDIYIFQVGFNPGEYVLLRNSKKDGRKGDKLVKPWLGPCQVKEVLGKVIYPCKPSRGKTLQKAVNGVGG